MSYYEKKIVTNGVEKDFIKSVIGFFTSINDVTCSDDIDEIYSQTGITPSFTINFNHASNTKLKIARSTAISTTSSTLNFCAIEKDNENTSAFSCAFTNSAAAASTSSTRTITLSLFINNNFIHFRAWAFDKTTSDNAAVNIAFFHDNDFDLIKAVSNTSVFPAAMNSMNESDYHTSYTFYNRLSYAVSPDKIEVIKNKMLTAGTAYHKFTSAFDCSTIQKFSTVQIDDENYYAITENMLTKYE